MRCPWLGASLSGRRLPLGRDLLLPAALWAGGLVCSRAVGFRMRIPWDYYQLLDRQVLAAHPLGSLCYLHSQPPALNALLAGILRAADLVERSPEAVATVVFQALGLVAAIALFRIVVAATGSRAVAALGVLAALANPGYHVFANLFFYEFVVSVLLLGLLATAVPYLARGERRPLLLAVLLAAAICLTRTLFHPLWAVGFCLLLVLLRGAVAGAPSRVGPHAVLAVAVLLPLLALWPLKNWVVFGQPAFGSMTAYNLARGIPGCSALALGTFVTGAMPGEGVTRALEACGPAALPVLTAPTKSDGSRNWNHLSWLAGAGPLSRCGVDWRLQHPAEWLARAAGYYAAWTRATFVHPYGGQLVGPPTPAYLGYARRYENVLLFDLRPFLERLFPGWFLHRYAMIRGAPLPYTVFGFVLLPTVVVLLVALGRWRRPGVREALVALLLFSTFWPMVAACLTDGEEGNRMRFSVSALYVVMLACVGSEVWERIRAWRRSR